MTVFNRIDNHYSIQKDIGKEWWKINRKFAGMQFYSRPAIYKQGGSFVGVTKDMLIADILRKDTGTGIAEILMRAGMNCVGCPSAAGETLEQAGMSHGMDSDTLVEEINLYLQTTQA